MMQRAKLLLLLPRDIWQLFITYLPGRFGFPLRYRYWRKKLGFLGKNVRIDVGVHFQNPEYIEIHDNCWIDRNVMIMAGLDKSGREKAVRKNNRYPGKPAFVHIGRNVHISVGCIISGISSGVYISDDCGISAGCKFYSFTNHYRSKKSPSNENIHFSIMVGHDRQCIIEGPIFIGRNSGAGVNCVFLPGAAIPENCFVAINSVTSGGEFPENSIIAGNPAEAVKQRYIRS